MSHKFIFNLLAVFTLGFVTAQNAPILIKGKVLESNNKLPIEYATISLLDKDSNQVLSGAISAEDGTFKLKTNETNFIIEVSFMGFKTKTFSDFEAKKNIIDLNTIILSEDNQALDEIVVGLKNRKPNSNSINVFLM